MAFQARKYATPSLTQSVAAFFDLDTIRDSNGTNENDITVDTVISLQALSGSTYIQFGDTAASSSNYRGTARSAGAHAQYFISIPPGTKRYSLFNDGATPIVIIGVGRDM